VLSDRSVYEIPTLRSPRRRPAARLHGLKRPDGTPQGWCVSTVSTEPSAHQKRIGIVQYPDSGQDGGVVR